MAEYIKREAIMKFPIRKDHCDKKHANEHFIFGIYHCGARMDGDSDALD